MARRIERLQRLERLRAIAKQAAAREAAEAEGAFAQLSALAGRTSSLAADYARRSDPADALALHQVLRFAAGLQGLSTATMGDAGRAGTFADAKQAELVRAERRRAAVAERLRREAEAFAARQMPRAIGPRRPVGTAFE